jgi:hypothetical protein
MASNDSTNCGRAVRVDVVVTNVYGSGDGLGFARNGDAVGYGETFCTFKRARLHD